MITHIRNFGFKSTKPYDVVKGFLLNVGNTSGSVDQILVNGGVFYNYSPAAGDDVRKGSFLADGKHLSLVIDDEGRSVYTVEDGLEEVASIDSGSFDGVSGAFKLSSDIELNAVLFNDMFIDLNGHTLKFNFGAFFSGYLIICDSSKEQNGIIKGSSDDAVLNASYFGTGYFSFCGGHFEGSRFISEWGDCTAEFFNGTISGKSLPMGMIIATSDDESLKCNVIVYGGTFIDSNSDIVNDSRTFNISGSSITICGGKFTSNGATIVGHSGPTGDITILGGTFTGDQPSEDYTDGARVIHAEGSNTWTVTLY